LIALPFCKNISILGSRSAAAAPRSRGRLKSTLDAYPSFMAAGRIAGIAENLISKTQIIYI
jgi:hypothetical protein